MKEKKNVPQYKLKTPKILENTVVETFHKIETGVVSAYKNVEDKFVDTFLEKIENSEENTEERKS